MNPETNFSIKCLKGGFDNNLSYVISCSHTGNQVLVDASIELTKIYRYVHQSPAAILITHSHKDHLYYLQEYTEAYPKMAIIGHPDSEILAKKKNFQGIGDNKKLKCGHLEFISIHTPGHYYDSICYLIKPALFTGDTMFVGRTGRVISRKSSVEDLYHSVYMKILKMPENVRIYPGHDYGKEMSILLEKNVEISPLLQADDLEDFKRRMQDYEESR